MKRNSIFWSIVVLYFAGELLTAITSGVDMTFFMRNALAGLLLYFVHQKIKWVNTVFIVLLAISIVFGVISLILIGSEILIAWPLIVLTVLNIAQLVLFIQLRKIDF